MRLLDAGLPGAGDRRVGAAGGRLGGHAPVVRELRAQGSRAAVEREAHEVPGPRIGPALHRGVQDRRPGAGELQDDGRGDELRRPERVGAGLGGRRGGPEGRHRHPRDRHAGGGEHERRLDRVLVDDQRRDRADEVAQHRPAAQLLGAAGDDGRHLHGVAGFALAVHHPLQVLDGVVPAGVELVQLRRLAAVAGAERRPPERDAGERVLEPGDVRQVRLRRLAALPRLEVDDLDAAPVRGAVGAAVADGDVAARVAGAEGEASRRRRHRLEHEGRRQLGDLGRPVHDAPRPPPAGRAPWDSGSARRPSRGCPASPA